MVSWYEPPDGRGHYEPQPYDEPTLMSYEELAEDPYLGPVKRELRPEDKHPTWNWLKGYKAYTCRRCKTENRDDTCLVCGAPCDRKPA